MNALIPELSWQQLRSAISWAVDVIRPVMWNFMNWKTGAGSGYSRLFQCGGRKIRVYPKKILQIVSGNFEIFGKMSVSECSHRKEKDCAFWLLQAGEISRSRHETTVPLRGSNADPGMGIAGRREAQLNCVIFGAGPISDYKAIRRLLPEPPFTVLAADGGLRHTNALGIEPDVLSGIWILCGRRTCRKGLSFTRPGRTIRI